MAKKTRSFSRKIVFSMLIVSFLLILSFGIGEVLTRLFYHPDSPYFDTAELDQELGWRPKGNFSLTQTITDAKGEEYEADYQTSIGGFRAFGKVNTDTFKILFLGDSYTQSVEVSNDETFYQRIADSLDVEVFAYGMGGYSNLQEYLILETYLDTIQPDLVVLQVCDNDFMDNHHQLEREAVYRVRLMRPYLGLDGEIRQLLPTSDWQNFLSQSKFFAYLIRARLNLRALPAVGDTTIAEYQIANHPDRYQTYLDAIQITQHILQRFQKTLSGRSKFIAFSSSLFQPQLSSHQQICKDLKIPFYIEPARNMEQAKNEGQNLTTKDGYHWNPAGQQMMADQLIPLIQAYRGAKSSINGK